MKGHTRSFCLGGGMFAESICAVSAVYPRLDMFTTDSVYCIPSSTPSSLEESYSMGRRCCGLTWGIGTRIPDTDRWLLRNLHPAFLPLVPPFISIYHISSSNFISLEHVFGNVISDHNLKLQRRWNDGLGWGNYPRIAKHLISASWNT